jgi:hypothetical protein
MKKAAGSMFRRPCRAQNSLGIATLSAPVLPETIRAAAIVESKLLFRSRNKKAVVRWTRNCFGLARDHKTETEPIGRITPGVIAGREARTSMPNCTRFRVRIFDAPRNDDCGVAPQITSQRTAAGSVHLFPTRRGELSPRPASTKNHSSLDGQSIGECFRRRLIISLCS